MSVGSSSEDGWLGQAPLLSPLLIFPSSSMSPASTLESRPIPRLMKREKERYTHLTVAICSSPFDTLSKSKSPPALPSLALSRSSASNPPSYLPISTLPPALVATPL